MRLLLAALTAMLALPGTALAGEVLLVEGGGFGHGVGLSQYGAEGCARHGWDYARIVKHYFPHTTWARTPDRPIRVLLAEGQKQVAVGSSAPFLVQDARGRKLHVKPRVLRFSAKLHFRGHVLVPPVRIVAGAQVLTFGGIGYRGDLVLYAHDGILDAVNEVPLERYLRAVVPAEMPWQWHLAAYEAQAVAARSYALSQLKGPGQTFDLYADQRDQMYGGIAAERPETNLAVGKTAGRILTWDGRPIVGYYSASSGGMTSAVSDVWPEKPQVPYLVPVRDPFDAISPYHRWTLALTPTELAAKLKVPVRDLRVEKNRSGRVVSVRVLGKGGATKVPVSDFREALGLRSSRFSIRVLSLDLPSGRAVYGKPLALEGFVRGLAGVVLQERTPSGSWRRVARVRGGRDGRFRAVVRPRYPTSYRLAVDGTPGPDVSVDVARRIAVRANGVVLAGKVQPAAPVRIERRVGRGWKPVAHVLVGPSGFFRTRLEHAGSYRAVAGGGRFLTSATPPVSVSR